ncbi:hypothetical protein GCM10007973_32950 [Polymorphobacter multimanifer]|uniref:Cytoskeletal protein RodZ n=1 Tax=Polymorphobacter multimanifer TaxID=1070431 RepID=A0A841LG16_9SPHN|nr:helix-turn-helix domain-containing protein [Polymorphobacter multimanifer]MBB6228745.1 cytoskeletal protein RodZ [Polymorphobacter multimanifer]GGI94210.1 hypothetical protein GCM10007973_32950 [Polymorphobacter multimanifer]
MTPAEDMPSPADLRDTVGGVLANARVASGRSLVDIASETRVPLRHLRALEADEHDMLPALPYAQGFVRSFARAVKLDPEVLAARFRAETSKQPHVPSVSTLEPLDERRLPSSVLVMGTLAALVVLVAALSAWGAGAFDAALPDGGAPDSGPVVATVETETAPVSSPPVLQPATGAGYEPGAAVATAAPAPASGQVVIEATEEVWVRIYDPQTKTVAMSGVMAPGERFPVPAEPAGLMLWTGKAGALRVTIGGAAIPPLGGPVQTLRAVSLAAADLQARGGGVAAGAAPAAVPATGSAVAPGSVSGVE